MPLFPSGELPLKKYWDMRWRAGLFALLIMVTALPSITSGAEPISKSKPFAEHFLVLQLSDADTAKQAEVLSVASNLLKYYGPDEIDIEIVAFGPGIRLMFAGNEYAETIDSLAVQGVRFDGCMNTINTIIRKTGHKPDLNPNMIPVQAGVARILELVEKGYTLVRP